VKYRLLGTNAPEEWMEALNRLPNADVYFLPQYHAAYELDGVQAANAFVAEDGSDILFYPFMLRPIDSSTEGSIQSFFDIETVYGYSGPLATTTDASFLAKAWQWFEAACRDLRVIAEFTRFNPVKRNVIFADKSQSIRPDRETVLVDLSSGENEVWSGYSASHRRKIRKACSLGLECRRVGLSEGMGTFKKLYDETMELVKADPFYFFTEAYYRFLIETLGDDCLQLFFVYDKDLVVAASLFLTYGDTIHYHLGGRMVDYTQVAANPALFDYVIQWGRQRGYRWLHLGGGRTAREDDGLFRFKAGISPLRRQFFTGRRVHNSDVYDELCSAWMRRNGLAERPPYFLLYRLEDYQGNEETRA